MEPVVMKNSITIEGTKFVENYTFKSGHVVPIYEVFNVFGLNQIIGYVKLINSGYGKVFYRGQCSLHDNMLPSLYHKSQTPKFINNRNRKLNKIIKNALRDKMLAKETRLAETDLFADKIIEGMLQHYGINTRCIDAVDNHWVALWFGLNKCSTKRIGEIDYATYSSRLINEYQMLDNTDSIYQYLILIAADMGTEISGVIDGKDILTIDLRIALPSTFLRPHAQHGIVLRRKLHTADSNYDISNNVVSILKIRNDLADKWLGNGELVKFNNLFPSQFHDHAYSFLLERQDLFCDTTNSIVQYIYE